MTIDDFKVLRGAEVAGLFQTWFVAVVPARRLERLQRRFSPTDFDAIAAAPGECLDEALTALSGLEIDAQGAAISAWPDDLLAKLVSRLAGSTRIWLTAEAHLPVLRVPQNALTVDELLRVAILSCLMSRPSA
jgi:hypothetical protein